ncbi:MAG: thioredoxin [Chitinophagaceae bacterium]
MAIIQLTTQDFKNKIFDYDKEQEWKLKGELPVIIDFYADWCGPCRMVAPVLEELSELYEGKLVIYKVDTEKELELSSVFNIRSIPSLLFIPLEGNPMMQDGALPKNILQQVIDEKLLKQKKKVLKRFSSF